MSTALPLPPQSPLHVAIVGVGGTGSEIAHALLRRASVRLSLIDVDEPRAEGKALDLWQSGALYGYDTQLRAGRDWAFMEGADIVVITAGRGRRPGEPREHMITDNGVLVRDLATAARTLCPNAYLIVLTNPADLLTHIAYEASGFPLHRVMGQGGILDSARLSTAIATTLGMSIHDVRSMVLGGHGDSMVPIQDFVTIHGVPARHLISDAEWQSAVERTRRGGEEILSRFKTHGASVTPGLAVCEMIDALSRPVPRLLPISTMPNGEYGLHGIFLGVPALVSMRGVERVVELPLAPHELAMLHHSAETQRQTYALWTRQREARA